MDIVRLTVRSACPQWTDGVGSVEGFPKTAGGWADDFATISRNKSDSLRPSIFIDCESTVVLPSRIGCIIERWAGIY